jgi:hypothetical protein
MKQRAFALLALSAALAACGPTPQPVVYQQPVPQYQAPAPVYQQAPVVVQQSGAGDVLTGMAVGAMIANSANSNRQAETRIIERRTTVINNVTQAPTPVAVAAPAKPSFVAPAAQPVQAVAPVKPSFVPQTVYKQAPITVTPTVTKAPSFAPAAAPRPAPVAAPRPSFVQTAPKPYASTTTTVRTSSTSSSSSKK